MLNTRLSPNTILRASRFEGEGAWRVNPFTVEIAAWHEFGHAWGFINGRHRRAHECVCALLAEAAVDVTLRAPAGGGDPMKASALSVGAGAVRRNTERHLSRAKSLKRREKRCVGTSQR